MATTSKPRTPRKRRAKEEVQQEFESIREEASTAVSYSNPKADEVVKQRESEITESVKDLAVEGILHKFSALNGEISKTLSSISEKMIGEVNLLSDLREAVAIETRELEKLHKLDIAQTALDQLIEEYSQQKDKLESEIETTRRLWEQESQAQACAIQESEENLQKMREREIEEYEYKEGLERKKAQDKYEEEARLREKQNRESQESLEKSWQMREAALKKHEEEFALLRKTVDEFPIRLKNEVDQATADSARQTEQRLSHEILLLKRDGESEKKMAELRIKTLEEIISRQTAQIHALESQVEEAKKQVQDIAVKAIEGASGSKALTHINQIAMEQAKTRSNSL